MVFRLPNINILWGPFNNYVTLKLLSFDLPTPPPPSSRFITNNHKTLLSYITPDTDPPFFIYFSFLNLKKKNKDTHPLMTHPPMFLSGHRVRISIFNELPDTEMTASTK